MRAFGASSSQISLGFMPVDAKNSENLGRRMMKREINSKYQQYIIERWKQTITTTIFMKTAKTTTTNGRFAKVAPLSMVLLTSRSSFTPITTKTRTGSASSSATTGTWKT